MYPGTGQMDFASADQEIGRETGVAESQDRMGSDADSGGSSQLFQGTHTLNIIRPLGAS